MSVIHLTKDTFESEVINAEGKVLIDFWATWCGPCRMIAPTIEQIAEERPDIKVCKIDVDAEPELAAAFRIMSIPTLVVVEGGKIVNQAVGAMPKDSILSMLD